MVRKSSQQNGEKFFLLHPSWTGNKASGFSRERIPSEDASWLVGSSESGKKGSECGRERWERGTVEEKGGVKIPVLVFCYCSLKAGPPRRNAKLMSSRRRERLWHGDS